MGRKNGKNEARTALPTSGNALATSGAGIAALRIAGETWDEIGRRVSGTERPVSAIRLRVPYRAFLASAEGAEAAVALAKSGKAGETITPLPADGASVVAARDGAGEGFPRIAARTGLPLAEVVALYRANGGEAPDGRIYVGAGGTRTLVGTDGSRTSLPPFSAKAARKRAKAAAKAATLAPVALSSEGDAADDRAARKAAKAAKRERKAAKAARKAAKAA